MPNQVLGDGTNTSRGVTENSEAYTCSQERQRQNQQIRTWCDTKWTHWGVVPKPDESQLRQVNECYNEENSWSSQMKEHCPEGVLAVPIMIFNLMLIGIVASQSPERGSPGYILTHGNLAELKGHFTEEVIRSRCNGIANDRDLRLLHESLCKEGGINACPTQRQRQWEAAVVEARACKNNLRSEFRENPSILAEIDRNAQAVFDERQRIKALIESNNQKINQIKATCDPIINPQRYNLLRFSPYFLQIDALKQAKDFIFPNRNAMIRYNRCVENQAVNDPELLNQLLRRTGSLIEKLYADAFGSLKCFNSENRIKYFCEMVGRIGTGGVVSLASVMAAKSARRQLTEATEDGLRRGIEAARRNADDAVRVGGRPSTDDLVRRHHNFNRRLEAATTQAEKDAIIADEIQRFVREGNEEYVRDGRLVFQSSMKPVTAGGQYHVSLYRANINGRNVFIKELDVKGDDPIDELREIANGQIIESLGFGPRIEMVEQAGKRYLVMDEVPGINVFELLLADQRTRNTKSTIDSMLGITTPSQQESIRRLAEHLSDNPEYFNRLREMARRLEEVGFKNAGDFQFMVDTRQGADSIQIIDSMFFNLAEKNPGGWRMPTNKVNSIIEDLEILSY